MWTLDDRDLKESVKARIMKSERVSTIRDEDRFYLIHIKTEVEMKCIFPGLIKTKKKWKWFILINMMSKPEG
jgi:hypothetical protein